MNFTAVPVNVLNIYNKAMDYSVKGDFDTALNEYRKVLNICPSFVEAYNSIGEIYSKRGNKDLAISTYESGLKINRNYRLLLNVGIEYYNYKHYHRALNYFQESLIIKPDLLEGNFFSGLSYYNLSDQRMAETYLKNVLQLDEKHLKSNYLLSYINYNKSQYDKTLFYLNNIKDIADDKMFLNKYFGFCYYHTGKYDEALKYLNLAVVSSPAYDKYKDYLKKLTFENKMKELGNLDSRIREMETAMIEKKPNMHELTKLSLLYTYKGEYKKAEDILAAYKQKIQ